MSVDLEHESAHLLLLRVVGRPTPQGSKRAIVNRHTGKPAVVESGGDRLRNWREDVRSAVAAAMRRTGYESALGPVEVRVIDRAERPSAN